jgi:alpha-L-arabinofuranosidase
VHESDLSATNTEHAPNRVVPRPQPTALTRDSLHVTLAPVSWQAVRLTRRTVA